MSFTSLASFHVSSCCIAFIVLYFAFTSSCFVSIFPLYFCVIFTLRCDFLRIQFNIFSLCSSLSLSLCCFEFVNSNKTIKSKKRMRKKKDSHPVANHSQTIKCIQIYWIFNFNLKKGNTKNEWMKRYSSWTIEWGGRFWWRDMRNLIKKKIISNFHIETNEMKIWRRKKTPNREEEQPEREIFI